MAPCLKLSSKTRRCMHNQKQELENKPRVWEGVPYPWALGTAQTSRTDRGCCSWQPMKNDTFSVYYRLIRGNVDKQFSFPINELKADHGTAIE